MTQLKEQKRIRRHARVRRAIATKDSKLRLCVHRSNRYISAQIIDDSAGHTLVSVSSKDCSGETFQARAFEAGKKLAELAKQASISEVVFDRGGYLYTGRIKALADGAREGGLVF
ncbi:MAG: 50S ribosomal protein L18 [Patescibacteria group bacterium]